MSRNKEKHVVGLNRMILQKQREEELEKNPIRPKLHTLNSAGEIKKWLPSIKKDIDYYLKQAEVPCYPERIVNEFYEKIQKLKGEYSFFIRKIKSLDPTIQDVPWTERPYETPNNKRQHIESKSSNAESSNKCQKVEDEKLTTFIPISTPILDIEKSKPKTYYCKSVEGDNDNSDIPCPNENLETFHHCSETMDKPLSFKYDFRQKKKLEKGKTEVPESEATCSKNLLGLNYSSSDEEG